MLEKLFIPKIIKDKVFHLQIGYQHLIIIDNYCYQNSIITNKKLEELFLFFPNLFFFDSLEEMENDLELLVRHTNDDYIVIIG